MGRVVGGEVAVVIVGGYGDFVGFGHIGDPAGRGDAVPGDIDDRDIHRVLLEKRPVLARRDQIFMNRSC